MAKLIQQADQIDFQLTELGPLPQPNRVMMVQPSHYTVEYAINPHMVDNIGKVNREEASKQWEAIRDTFNSIDLPVHEVEGQPGLPDMVFCANQSLPYITRDGKKHTVMSIMHADERKDEVPFIEQWYRQSGYEVLYLDETEVDDFEGMGDAIWHDGRRLLWGGYGYRTTVDAYKQISDTFDIPVILLHLVDESFYHLDTCFCILDEKTALIYPKAFTHEGIELIEKMFPTIIRANEDEALNRFACNATCPDGKNVLIQEGCTEVNKHLRENGFIVHELETGEFLKSGGSVFCMKMLLW